MSTHKLLKWVLKGLPVYLVLSLVILGCQTEEPEAAATVDDIMDNPSEYMGQTVTLSGDVEQAYGASSFSMGGGTFGEGLMVVVPTNAAVTGGRAGMTPFYEGDEVQVTGTVREFVVTEIEQEYGLDLDPELEVEVEERGPVLVAQTVGVTPGMGGPTMEMGTDTTGMMGDPMGMPADTTVLP